MMCNHLRNPKGLCYDRDSPFGWFRKARCRGEWCQAGGNSADPHGSAFVFPGKRRTVAEQWKQTVPHCQLSGDVWGGGHSFSKAFSALMRFYHDPMG